MVTPVVHLLSCLVGIGGVRAAGPLGMVLLVGLGLVADLVGRFLGSTTVPVCCGGAGRFGLAL